MIKDFEPCLTLPKKNDKFYNTKDNNGYSTAIKGSPMQSGLNTLSNCVGLCLGRFHFLADDSTFSLLRPVNAEKMIQYADKRLIISQVPTLGACAVWEGIGNLAGHVASVEVIKSPTEIITADSGYQAKKPFWVTNRKCGADNNWGENKNYKFLGFIQNPAVNSQGKIDTEWRKNFGANNTISTEEKIKPSTTISKVNSESFKVKTVTESAKSLDKNLSGIYKVVSSDGLNMRTGAGTDNDIIVNIPYGEKVQNYGYFTQVGTTKWLYVQCVLKGVKYTGFVSGSYLRMA